MEKAFRAAAGCFAGAAHGCCRLTRGAGVLHPDAGGTAGMQNELGKSWENHKEIMGKSWEHRGKMVGKWWEHAGKMLGTW